MKSHTNATVRLSPNTHQIKFHFLCMKPSMILMDSLTLSKQKFQIEKFEPKILKIEQFFCNLNLEEVL